jgi:hypothetical protein
LSSNTQQRLQEITNEFAQPLDNLVQETPPLSDCMYSTYSAYYPFFDLIGCFFNPIGPYWLRIPVNPAQFGRGTFPDALIEA